VKRVARRTWITCAVLTAVAWGLHVACASWLGARDPIALASRGQWIAPATVALVLASSRAFLLFVAPGWWLWLAVRTLASRLRRKA
jgi:hypothetical protein